VIFHPRDLVTCCNFGWNITKWAESIFPPHGRINTAIDAYASTYSIGIPEGTFLVIVLPMTVDAIKAAAGCSDKI
jgi:hypothetical protein